MSSRIQWTNESVDELIAGKNIERLQDFGNVHSSLEWRCTLCGHKWNTTFQNIKGRHTGCPRCAAKKRKESSRLTDEVVDARLRQLNNDIIRIDDVIDSITKIRFKCLHDDYMWSASPNSILNKNTGCPKCSSRISVTTDVVDSFLRDHKRTFTRLTEVKNNRMKVSWLCSMCNHEWITTPSKIINQRTGCPKCSNRIRLTNDNVDERIKRKNLPLTRIGDYVNISTKIEWKCNVCQSLWKAKPSNILNEHTGCPICRTPSYSKKSIKWLNRIMLNEGHNIRHAENGGEYTLPECGLKVDGYCKETNTVYEFYGDIFHGNPARYAPDFRCSPYHEETSGELFMKTVEREKKITYHGYKLITIWEYEYDNSPVA